MAVSRSQQTHPTPHYSSVSAFHDCSRRALGSIPPEYHCARWSDDIGQVSHAGRLTSRISQRRSAKAVLLRSQHRHPYRHHGALDDKSSCSLPAFSQHMSILRAPRSDHHLRLFRGKRPAGRLGRSHTDAMRRPAAGSMYSRIPPGLRRIRGWVDEDLWKRMRRVQPSGSHRPSPR